MMIRPALGTIATRLFVTVMNLLVIMVAGHRLGAEGLGTIGLLVLSISFILLLNNVVGGGALTYLVPRHGPRRLLLAAYGWAFLSALVCWGAMQWLPLVPDPYIHHVAAIALLQSLVTVHMGLLLGQQRLRIYNTVALVQAATLLLVFVGLMEVSGMASVMDHVRASYIASGSAVVLSGIALRSTVFHSEPTEGRAPWASLFRHGLPIQAANFLQLLNYRVAYYLIEAFRGLSALGPYTVAVQMAEGAWLVPRSLGTVLYSKLSNTHDTEQQRTWTLVVTKGAVATAVLVIGVLLLLPEPFFRLLFGQEVVGIPALVLLLAPGIVAMAASQGFSHYFSGTGRNRHNAIGSGIGLAITLPVGFLLVPQYGAAGAAITATLAYGSSVFYQMIVFMRLSGASVRHLLPNAGDARTLQQLWRSMIGKHRKVTVDPSDDAPLP